MIQNCIHQRRELAQAAFADLGGIEGALEEAATTIIDCLRRGGTVFACGNGGSAAEAQHFTTELIGRFRSNRHSLPAVALTADGVALTCIANDFGWDAVFARQIQGLARPGDVLVCLSTSGESANIMAALQTARTVGVKSIALLGRDGGRARALATHVVLSPGADTASIQETQLWCIHALCEAVEAAFPMRSGHVDDPDFRRPPTQDDGTLITVLI
jgi:D-sedoheptulose 7-phosphate isomerase